MNLAKRIILACIAASVACAVGGSRQDIKATTTGTGMGVSHYMHAQDRFEGAKEYRLRNRMGYSHGATDGERSPSRTKAADRQDEKGESSREPAGGSNMGLLLFVFVLAIFLGFELISRVPSQLHTPLMSGSNAISGITIVGALVAAGSGNGTTLIILGTLAVAFASINVVGGYLVTDRMLAMFQGKKRPGEGP
jgi:NAD(P) transhydrogenase subunit alpha